MANMDGTLTIKRPDGTTVKTPRPTVPALILPSSDDITWSPDGRWLSYVVEGLDSESLKGSGHAFVMVAADGTGVRTLPGRPSWSPDASHLAVQDATGQLLAGRADGADLAPIGVLPPPLTWAPDGTAFAFIRDGDVWTVGIDGNHLRNLTKFPLGGASGAAWSPDGGSIVVSQGSQLWMISTDGTRGRSMQARSRNIFENVTWSPDGTRFGVSPSGDELAIIEVADWSGGLLSVSGRISWSPDSKFAAFLDFAGPVSIANADGSGFHQLWTTTGDSSPPTSLAWLP
jgi:WD40 repeat protein